MGTPAVYKKMLPRIEMKTPEHLTSYNCCQRTFHGWSMILRHEHIFEKNGSVNLTLKTFNSKSWDLESLSIQIKEKTHANGPLPTSWRRPERCVGEDVIQKHGPRDRRCPRGGSPRLPVTIIDTKWVPFGATKAKFAYAAGRQECDGQLHWTCNSKQRTLQSTPSLQEARCRWNNLSHGWMSNKMIVVWFSTILMCWKDSKGQKKTAN